MCVSPGSADTRMRAGAQREARCSAGGPGREEGVGSKTDFQTLGSYVQPLNLFSKISFASCFPRPNSMFFYWEKQQDVGDGPREGASKHSAEWNKVRGRMRDNARSFIWVKNSCARNNITFDQSTYKERTYLKQDRMVVGGTWIKGSKVKEMKSS